MILLTYAGNLKPLILIAVTYIMGMTMANNCFRNATAVQRVHSVCTALITGLLNEAMFFEKQEEKQAALKSQRNNTFLL